MRRRRRKRGRFLQRMTDWAIPQQAKLKYTQLFNLHDRSRTGFLSGLQCRDILLQSGLPRNILAEIWNLSDIDGDGQLTREEFILAMHLTNHVRSGQSLPNELPSDLIPPSYRRTRSISTTSVHSATSLNSATSSNLNEDQTLHKTSDVSGSFTATTSVLNSNSFEDKRRENFEKGRAELERRRLKIIEQQSSVLAEQLKVSKKQVTEAKAKIDLMRTERDTKMGLITSLEAQLKTLQDRKAYLNHEELSLIAIAKDLNLVNPAQAELDQLATQAKQQSINLMKEKLGDYLKEKEEKAKELAEITKRLEVLKKESKSLTETVNKTYALYKEKVTKAKEKRQEFIDENKHKTADLDSAWDTALSFSPKQTFDDTFDRQQIKPSNDLSNQSSTLSAADDPWGPSTNIHTATFNSSLPTKDIPGDFPPSTTVKAIPDTTVQPDKGFNDDEKLSNLNNPQITRRYKALYAFEARNPDELTISPGDIITGSEVVCEPGWLSGESDGRSGLFPEAYVEPVSALNESRALPKSSKNNNDSFTNPAQELGNLAQDFSNFSLPKDRIRYKVIYAFEARNPDELTINPGDIITSIVGAHEPGWLMGEFDGQTGLFPEAYVEQFVEEIVQDSNQQQQTAESGVSCDEFSRTSSLSDV